MSSIKILQGSWPAKPFQTHCVDADGVALSTYPDWVVNYQGPLTDEERRIYKTFLPDGVEYFDKARDVCKVDLLKPTAAFLDKQGVQITFAQEWDMMVADHVRTVIVSKRRCRKSSDSTDSEENLPLPFPIMNSSSEELSFTSDETETETETEKTVVMMPLLPPVMPIPTLYYVDNNDRYPGPNLRPPFQQVLLIDDPIKHESAVRSSRDEDDSPRQVGRAFLDTRREDGPSNAPGNLEDSSDTIHEGNSSRGRVYTLQESIDCLTELEKEVDYATRLAAINLARDMSKLDIVGVLKKFPRIHVIAEEFLCKPNSAFVYEVEVRQPGEIDGILSFPRDKVPQEAFSSLNFFLPERLERRLNIEELYFVEYWREMLKLTELHYNSHARFLEVIMSLSLTDREEVALVKRHLKCLKTCRSHFKEQSVIHKLKMNVVCWYMLDEDYKLGQELDELMQKCVDLFPTAESVRKLARCEWNLPVLSSSVLCPPATTSEDLAEFLITLTDEDDSDNESQ